MGYTWVKSFFCASGPAGLAALAWCGASAVHADLIELDLLDSIAELGSLGRAANRHRMSQPAVSMRMSQLERRLGVTSLQRGPAGARLTPAGERVVALSRRVLSETRELMAGVEALVAEESSHQRVSASLTVAEYLLPGWLAALHRQSPDAILAVEVTNSARVVARVAEHHADVGFVVLPDWVRARGLALNLTVTAGATAVGSAAWGAVANALGISGAFGWGSLAVALTLLAGGALAVLLDRHLRSVPAPLAEPDTPLTVPADGGPVFVTVSYQVKPGVEDDFQRAVQPLGWSRRRTGAVRWAVVQHAESPGPFVEMFVVASWDEYLPQQERRTVADAALDDRLRAFLRAGTEPDVQRFLTPPKPRHHHPDQR
jgi:molybdenum-dependent DNA-binding transcriptional regulator ModE